MTRIDHEMYRKIVSHLENANRKHPLEGFKDVEFGCMLEGGDLQEYLLRFRSHLCYLQSSNDKKDKRREISWRSILNEELNEFEYEYIQGNKGRAIDELYDIIAVCIRAIHHIGKGDLTDEKKGDK